MYDYVENKDCWFKDICKYRQSNDCSDMACPIIHKMNSLVELSLLNNKDRFPIPLFIDSDGTDKEKFLELREIQKNIHDFVIDGKNLFIYSKIPGNGKSSWAKKLLLSWFKSIVFKTDYECRGIYISVPKLLLEFKNNISSPSEYVKKVKERIPYADLVIWDEIGVKTLTAWEHDILFDFLNTRLESGLANIYTTNQTPEELRDSLGDRLYSRIIQLSTLIEFKGKDKRGLSKDE